MARRPELPAIEVVYALPERQRVVALPLRDGLTARQAVAESGLLEEFPELAAAPLALGVYGQRVANDQVLVVGDRVEIYRPLPVDPRARRRQAAAAGMPRGGRVRR